MAGAYALRLAEVIENWPFVVLLGASVVAAGAAARARVRPDADEAAAPPPLDALEWVGVTVPWTAAHLSRVTEGLGLDGVPPPETASRAKATPVIDLTEDAPVATSVSGNGADHGRA
jgi:hypothetical protein